MAQVGAVHVAHQAGAVERHQDTERRTRSRRVGVAIDAGSVAIDAADRIALVNTVARRLRNLAEGPGGLVKDCHPKATYQVLDRVMGYLRSGDDAGPAHSIIKEKEGRYETTYAPVRSPAGAYLVAKAVADVLNPMVPKPAICPPTRSTMAGPLPR